jgi:hypothetical protein
MKTKSKIAFGIAAGLILAGIAFFIFPSSHLPRAQTPPAAGTLILKNQLVFAGYETPEATLETVFWAIVNGDYDAAIETVPKDQAVKAFGKNPKQLKSELQQGEFQGFKSMQILARKNVSADKVELKFETKDSGNDESDCGIGTMIKIGNEWKFNFNALRDYTTNWDKSGNIVTFAAQ